MNPYYWLRARWRALFGARHREQELGEELESFVELQVAEKMRLGVAPAEARRLALIELGGLESTRELVRESRAGASLGRLGADLRFGLRLMKSNPGFSLAVLLTLALGVGANSAIYSLGQAVLFRSPPVQRPDRLVAIWTTCRRGAPRCASSYPDYLDYRSRASTLEDVAAYNWLTASLASSSGARVVTVQQETGNYFSLLGVQTHLGRPLLESDDQPGIEPVAVLSHSFWSSYFGSDPNVVGRRIRLNGHPVEVVGVAAAGFLGLHLDGGPDIHIPFLPGAVVTSDPERFRERLAERNSRWIQQLVGRRTPAASLAVVRAEMAAISDRLASEDAAARGPRKITVDSAAHFILPPGQTEDLKAFVVLLAGVVGMTLLLACANLSNLILARGMARQLEMGVRVAMGARRSRLVRQQLTETLLLAGLGGALGLLIARLLLDGVSGFELPGGILIESIHPRLDTGVVLVTLGFSLAAGVLVGIFPALHGSRFNLARALVQGGGRVDSGRGANRLRRTLIGVQLALSLVLLVGTGLFLQALQSGLSTDLGFRPGGLVAARVDLSLLHYSAGEGIRFVEQLLARLESFPGVEAAGAGTRLPLDNGGSATFLTRVEGYQPAPDEELRINYDFFQPGFARALGIRLEAGSSFEADSSADAILINHNMAERWWQGRNPVGGTVQIGQSTFRVVGVLEDTRWGGRLDGAPEPFVFLPLPASAAHSVGAPISVFARTAGDSSALMTFLREQVRELDPDLSATSVTTMEDQLNQILMPQRIAAFLFSCFASLGLLLAAVGIYGITSFSVRQRSREIGLRVAVGARNWQILWLMEGQLALPVLFGLGLGIVLTLLLGGTAESFLLGKSASDGGMLLLSVLALVLVVVAASVVPSYRAARLDPLKALRSER